jgi:23S rRNA (uracil1939-C5)-methyltransferase
VTQYPVRKGERVRLQVDALAFGGKGVARVQGYTLFVEGGLPGQEVEATVVRRKRGHGDARVERVLRPSPLEVEPPCRHFGVCGGCAFQSLGYPAQLEAKRAQVGECLERLGGLADIPVLPPLPSPDLFAYRNKMEYSFSTRWLLPSELEAEEQPADRFGLGLHVRRRFDRVVNVERCHLQSEDGSRVLRLVRDLARRGGLPVYSTRTHRGFWRFLLLREGIGTRERMVCLITNRAPPGSREHRAVEQLARTVVARGPRITSFVHGINTGKAAVAVCEETRVLHGEGVIRERLLGLTFEIGPGTFFQTNTRGAEQLFQVALERGELMPEDTVWDLYCGVGALSLPLAARARRVVGAEIIPEAAEAARRNARLNGVENVEFLTGDIRSLLAGAALQPQDRPDVVVVDPPREGVHPEVVQAVLGAAPRRIVYVSCNPATLARDLGMMVQGGYAVESVQPVDLFPHTAHIEAVAGLTRRF